MKRYLLLAAIALIGVLIVVSSVLFYELSDGLCGNTLIGEAGHNRLEKVIIFSRNCGATTDISTHVSIVPYDKELSDSDTGNIFRATAGTSTLFNGAGSVYVYVGWDGDNPKLFVRYPKGTEVFRQIKKFKSIDIQYSALPDIDAEDLSVSEKYQLLNSARSYVIDHGIDAAKFELVFLKRWENWIVFKLIPFNTKTWALDEAWLYLEKVDGAWVVRSLGTGDLELWEKVPEIDPWSTRLNR